MEYCDTAVSPAGVQRNEHCRVITCGSAPSLLSCGKHKRVSGECVFDIFLARTVSLSATTVQVELLINPSHIEYVNEVES